jgi:hypothetical protein
LKKLLHPKPTESIIDKISEVSRNTTVETQKFFCPN